MSGNGSNLQALLDGEKAGSFKGKISLVISDRPGVYALERAKNAGIPAFVIEPDMSLSKDERRLDLSEKILHIIEGKDIGLIVLAGFLSILTGGILQKFSGRIINLHPALLPKFGGQGMYGANVHQAVLDAGETESGCTVHLADGGIDTGEILLQRKVPVLPGDTADSLAQRIHPEEHIAIAEAVKIMAVRLNKKKKIDNSIDINVYSY